MEWKTSISYSNEKETIIRGYDLLDLMKEKTFSEVIFLLLKGELPTKSQKNILDAILVSSIDHGIEPPSIISTRSVASTGNSLNASVAAGILSLGKYHGGAIEDCAEILMSELNPEEIVKNAINSKKRLGGFGHKVYKEEDPRTTLLFEVAKNENIFAKHCEKALEIESELEKQKGKKLCLNVDGAIAAIILEMGFDPKMANLFFIIARTPGISAHAYEEISTEKPVRRLNDSKYIGEKKRKI